MQEATKEGRLAMSLQTPKLFSRVAGGVTCNGDSDCVSLLREPDAANPHVRFDERGVETEAWRNFQGTLGLRQFVTQPWVQSERVRSRQFVTQPWVQSERVRSPAV